MLPAVDYLTSNGACFEDGQTEEFDTIVLATGYRSNVPQWLKVIFCFLLNGMPDMQRKLYKSFVHIVYDFVRVIVHGKVATSKRCSHCFLQYFSEVILSFVQDDGDFFSEEGFPRNPSPGAWKSQRGLYVAGLGRKGILGATFDAKKIAQDIANAFPEADGEWCSRVFPCQPR